MKAPTEYTVMGEDGNEYGPAQSKQIRQWIAEGRLEKKTPVKPSDARDWVFLGDVPEFAGLFAASRVSSPMAPPRRGLVKLLVISAVAAAAYFLYQYLHRH
jgi:hypothetical protein